MALCAAGAGEGLGIWKGKLGSHFKMARIRSLRHVQLMQLVASTVTLDWSCGHASEQCDGSEEESVHG